MSETEVNPREPEEFWERPTDERHRFQLARFHGHRLEVEDLHFHHDSAVLLPDYETEETAPPPGREHLTGLAVLRAAYLHAGKESAQKLLIAGHTDTSGGKAYNLKLSLLRARGILHALLGERDDWVGVALQKNKVEDYQQILKWVAKTWGWGCDTGSVDNKFGPITKAAVEAFQAGYNREFDASISVDGAVGRQTWGAVFDIYMRDLAYILETDEAGLAQHRAKLKFLKTSHKAIGCGEHHPVESPDREDYRSATNRRVELLFFDPGEGPPLDCHPSAEACDPGKCLLYNRRYYRYEPIDVEPVPTLVWLDLQTVDEFGYGVPEAPLKLDPEYGDEVSIATDKKAYWSGRVRADGKIEVWMADGRPVRFGASIEGQPASGGAEETAVIVPRVASRTVTDIVVPSLSKDLIEARRNLVERYGRVPLKTGGRSVRGGAPRRDLGEPVGPSSKRGGKEQKITRRTIGNYVADNLFIAAGWDDQANMDVEKLLKILHQWLGDCHPSAIRRGYFVQLAAADRIVVVNVQDDGKYEIKGPYNFVQGVSLKSRIGAHAPFEFFGAGGNMLFVDMASASTGIAKGQVKGDKPKPAPSTGGTDARKAADQRTDDGAAGEDGQPAPERRAEPLMIWEVIEDGKRDEFKRHITGLVAQRRVELVYRLPGGSYAARCGGTGLLEDYRSGDVRTRIHARNRAVMKNVARAYGWYIDTYVEKVRAIDPDTKKAEKKKLPHPEIQLYDLGPPDSHFVFPQPAGCTDAEYRELVYAGASTAGIRSWQAIAQKYDDIWGIRSEGSVWMVFEFSAAAGSMAGPFSGCNVKLNFEADDQGRIKPLTVTRTISLKAGTGKNAVTVEVDPATGKQVVKANVGVGLYGAEVDSTGNVKFTAGPAAFSEYNHMTRQVGAGIEIGVQDLVKKHFRRKGVEPPAWVDKLPDIKFKIGLYFQLIHDSTLMKVISGAPGLWQLRPRSEFIRLDWASLDWDEQRHLTMLGWDRKKWDTRTFPRSALKPWTYLSAKEKMASIHLPVPSKDPYWQDFWLNTFRKARRLPPAPAATSAGAGK